jgi:hypothetical protein
MKTIRIIILAVSAAVFTSCATTSSSQKSENELAGYTLKNKKELMEQKVLCKSQKTLIAQP